MRKIGAILGITALAGVVFSPPPAAAFDIRVGPFISTCRFSGTIITIITCTCGPTQTRRGTGLRRPSRWLQPRPRGEGHQTDRDALAETNTEPLERCTGLAPGLTDLPIDQIRLTVRP